MRLQAPVQPVDKRRRLGLGWKLQNYKIKRYVQLIKVQ